MIILLYLLYYIMIIFMILFMSVIRIIIDYNMIIILICKSITNVNNIITSSTGYRGGLGCTLDAGSF